MTALSLVRDIVYGVARSVVGDIGVDPLVFHALTPDPLTFEIKDVLKGVGDLTEARTGSIFLPDHQGRTPLFVNGEGLSFADGERVEYVNSDVVWREVKTTVPAWKGGRVVENLSTKSEGDVTSGNWGTSSDSIAAEETITLPNGATGSVMKFGFSGNPAARLSSGFADVSGKKYIISYWIRSVSGEETGLRTRTFGATIFNLSAVTTTWQRLAYADESINSEGYLIRNNEAGTSGDVYIWGVQLEDVTEQSDTVIPGEYIKTTGSAVQKVFGNINGNSVSSNVVTAGIGAELASAPWLVGQKALTNDQIRSFNLADGEWTKSNMSAALDAIGMRGDANGATTLTATAGNATCIANVISDASDDQTTRWVIKRKTGTGIINITVDNGVTWQDVTAEVDSNSGFNECLEDQAALANPQIGIRIVTNTDAVYVGNAEAFLGVLDEDVRTTPAIFTVAAAVSINANDDSFDLANHNAAQGGRIIDWQPQYATSEVSGNIEILSLDNNAGLLFYDADNSLLKSTDGTNTASVALTIIAGVTYKVWVAWGSSLQVGVDGATGTAVAYDGAFATGTKIEVITPSNNVNLVRELRGLNTSFADAVSIQQTLAA